MLSNTKLLSAPHIVSLQCKNVLLDVKDAARTVLLRCGQNNACDHEKFMDRFCPVTGGRVPDGPGTRTQLVLLILAFCLIYFDFIYTVGQNSTGTIF